MNPPRTPETALASYLATVNRLAAARRKEAEDRKIAKAKRLWWLDETATLN